MLLHLILLEVFECFIVGGFIFLLYNKNKKVNLMIYKIYALYENTKENIRYIGCTQQTLERRYKSHLNEAIRRVVKNKRTNWLFKCIKNNIEVGILLLYTTETENEMFEKEVSIIKEYKENGYKLVNGNDGGRGSTKKPTEKEKLKSSLAVSKITKKEIIHIKALLATGEYTNVGLAKQLNKSSEFIRSIKTLKTYKNVGSEYNEKLLTLKHYQRENLTETDIIEIKMSLISKALTKKDIRKKYKVSEQALCDIIHLRTYKTFGEQYNKALTKLKQKKTFISKETKKDIYSDLCSGISVRDIVKKYKISEAAVRVIKKRCENNEL